MCSIIGLITASTSVCVLANSQSEFSFNGEANAGAIHNSALSVDEIDSVSNESDSGKEIGFKLNAKWHASEKLKLGAGYAYKQQSFNQFNQYDLAIHQANIDTSYQLKTGEIGLRIDAASASLAKEKFLDFQQASLYYGWFLQPQTYMRTSLKVKNKSLAELNERDAEALGLSADVFHFANNANTMFMLGFNLEKENANNEEFTFKGLGFNTKVTHKFTVFGLNSKVGLNWRFQNKDYLVLQAQDSESQEAIERDENRHVVTASWSLNILDNLALETELEHGDYRSDLDALTYQQNTASVGIRYKW